jgi:hypothetical protein
MGVEKSMAFLKCLDVCLNEIINRGLQKEIV